MTDYAIVYPARCSKWALGHFLFSRGARGENYFQMVVICGDYSIGNSIIEL